MAAAATLIALEPAAIDQPMLMAIAAGTAESIGPARLLWAATATQKPKGSTLLLGAVEPLELKQGEAFLELDHAVMVGLVFVYQSTTQSRPARTELGNRVAEKSSEPLGDMILLPS